MNIIFLSPHAPGFSSTYCFYLKQAGANVLAIGDKQLEESSTEVPFDLTAYYAVSDMNDYQQLLRAVGFFIHQYGKIDKIESLDKQWLETEAKLRSDFNIFGIKVDFVNNILHKSRLKFFFNKAGVHTARCLTCHTKTSARDFIREVGYPVKMRPEGITDTEQTYIIRSDREFEGFYRWWQNPFKCTVEAFIDGRIIAYDGLIDRFGVVHFAVNLQFGTNQLHLFNGEETFSYICLRDNDPEVIKAGNKILKALDVRERYFHMEFIQSASDGQLFALGVHIQPPEWWITDAINFSYKQNIFHLWANLLISTGVEVKKESRGSFLTAFVSRSRRKEYVLSHEEVLDAYPGILKHGLVNEFDMSPQGNYAYLFRSKSMDEVRQFIEFVKEERLDYII